LLFVAVEWQGTSVQDDQSPMPAAAWFKVRIHSSSTAINPSVLYKVQTTRMKSKRMRLKHRCCCAPSRLSLPSLAPPILPSSFHLPSTPRALAREVGCRRCLICCCGRCCVNCGRPLCPILESSSSLFHPPCTPRANVLEAGGGWCVTSCRGWCWRPGPYPEKT
jgi:hypothetical protein